MRLLRAHDDSTFSLEEFYKDIPPYAMLSHTWGPDDEEVTFKNILENSGQSKSGYAKLRFCSQQAAKDVLEYFWVDTCCIDKTSSAELSEAINSMFRWYRNSEKCYVYLADVHSPEYNVDGHMFHQSRWFTRGWTLQELLAPTCVEFFTKDFQYIGSRNSLSASIIQATGIPEEALQGYPLYKFTVAQRLKWAKHRSTKREEDTAYSLLGIFDVYMPLIYGEGKERAMSRLMHATDEHERRQHGYLFKWLRLMFPRVMVKYNAYESFVFWMVFGSILGVTIAYHGIADWFTAYTAKGARFAVRDMKVYPGLGLLSVASLSYLFRYH